MPATRMPESWNGTLSGRRGRTVNERQPGDTAGAAVRQRPAARLTGRGGVLVVFALCLFGVFVADKLHLGALAGVCYLAACVFAASAVRRTQLLPVVVTPPMLFGAAVVCVQAMTSRAGVLSVAEGTLVTLGNVAPWLFAGTALGTVIALARGLRANVRALREGLHGERVGLGTATRTRTPAK